MYKILIVDDEVITRKGLMKHINWEKIGITVVNAVAGAREAINFMANNEVDIVLSDVRMPGMNGIDMCTEIRKIAPQCQIIFLSGYSNKEYLKGAIELEAVSYVEKPINVSEIEEAIGKAVAKIDSSRVKEEKFSRAIEDGRNYVKATFLQKLIGGRLGVIEAKEYMEKLGLEWNTFNRFNMSILKSGNSELDLDNLADKVSEVVWDINHIYYIKDSRYLIFLFAYSENDKDNMKKAYQRVATLANEEKQLKLNGSFGCTVSNILHVNSSYNSAAVLMQQLFFYGYGKVNSYIKETKSEEKVEIDEMLIKRFQDSINRFDSTEAYDVADTLFEEVKENCNVLVSYVKSLYFKFVQIVLSAAENSKNDYKKNNDTELVAYIWEKLNIIETVEECHNYLREEMDEYFENTKDLANNSRLIIDIMEYVKNNYMNPELCLNDIADSVFITPNYMNTLFKKKFGKTVGQHITDVRMTAAKKLIMNRQIKLADVAEMVGYNDPGYFTKVFRKNVGVNPKDFRER